MENYDYEGYEQWLDEVEKSLPQPTPSDLDDEIDALLLEIMKD